MSLAELKAKLAAVKAEGSKLHDALAALGQEPNDEQLAKLEGFASEASELEAQIQDSEAKRERAAKAAAALAAKGFEESAAGAVPVIEGVKDLAPEDPCAGFKSGPEFMRAVMAAGQGRAMDSRLEHLAAVGSDENRGNSDPLGGFLIPEGFSPNLLELGFEGDPTANLTTAIPMDAPSVTLPARVDKNHSTSVTGGFQVYRGNQASEMKSSKGEFEDVTLKASYLTGLCYATDALLNDSPISFAAIIANSWQQEMGNKMFDEKINGTGVGEFEGILNSPALVSVAKESGQAADTINGTNIVNMRSRCYGYNNAVWLANHDTIPQLAKAHLPGTNSDHGVFYPSLQAGVPDMLMGRPIFFTEYASKLGDKGDLMLVDWSQYLMGNYQGPQQASSMHVRFTANEQAFRITARNDARCWWRSALTPKKSSATLSPLVTLAARA